LRRILKLTISIGFFFYMRVKSAILSVLGLASPATCVILYYHGVPAKDRLKFAQQMDEMVRSSTPIACDNRGSLAPGKHYSAVTFDDGILSAVENAVPELVARKIPATIFVVANLVGARPDWATFGPQHDALDRVVSIDQLSKLPSDLITIGSHTLSHPWLPSLSESEARAELFGSRDKLAHLLQRNITLFSFPYGAMNERLLQLCRDAGYERVFTIIPRLALLDAQEFMTGRIAVNPTDWPIEFKLKLLGGYQWLPAVFKLKAKLLPRSPSPSYNALGV